MIPINELQGKIYQMLNSDLEIKVYDEVPKEASMPLLSIGDYTLSNIECKDVGYTFNWNIDIYTDYEGKKQVSGLVNETLESIYKLVDEELNEEFSIGNIMLDTSTVRRVEGYYVANLVIKIEIS